MCWVLVLGHALVLMCQGMAFSVAMNSKRAPALMALIIASNFAEVKGASPCTPPPFVCTPTCGGMTSGITDTPKGWGLAVSCGEVACAVLRAPQPSFTELCP